VLRPLVDMTAKEKNDYLCKTAAADLFEIKPAQPLPEKARIFKSITCECCGEQTAEYYTRNENGKIVCLDCVHPYNRFLLI
jgi:formylmethanofuran dehydrogenase subunit E